jgi:filamentous hemagglutinin
MTQSFRIRMHRLAPFVMLLGTAEMASPSADAATLPVPCVSGVCGPFVTSGQASAVQGGNTLTIGQSTDRAILNWSSFNISPDASVIFNQATGKSAVTLNRIHDANPSLISGSLKSNGQLYLINQNGFLFGSTARVNVGGLLASTLNMTDAVFNSGLLSPLQTGVTGSQNALFQDGLPATIALQPGSRVTTNEAGQRILLAASTVSNAGEITAVDGGQIIMAAGQKVYVAASDDARLRGLLIEVDGGGTVTNTGSVSAEHGNITAVGLAVNQSGRMTATTSVAANGSIRLLARDTVETSRSTSGITQITGATVGGALTIGPSSVTRVDLDTASTATAIDDQEQYASSVTLVGRTVDLKADSQIVAHGGQLSVIAASSPSAPRDTVAGDPGAHFVMERGAVIDLSGSDAHSSVTRNLVTVDLRANELADAPLQRDGPLRGKTVVIDARVGTPLAKVDGAIGLIQRDVLERTSNGGSALIDSAGDVIVAAGSKIDVSGGTVDFAGGAMRTSQLIRADGSVVDVGKASPDDVYVSLVNPAFKRVDDRWGVIEEIAAPGIGRFEPGYLEGRSAGSLQFLGHGMVLQGEFAGKATIGTYQRAAGSLPLGGQLSIGVIPGSQGVSAYRAPEIQLQGSAVPVSASGDTVLPEGLPLYLSTAFIRDGGFSRVSLSSDRAISVNSDASMDLGVGGSLRLTAPKIEVGANVTAAGGSIIATAVASPLSISRPGLYVGNGVTMNVGGNWINDTLIPLDQVPTGPTVIDAGSITLTQSLDGGRLEIGNNVTLTANGGAWLSRSGALVGGAGGSISIRSPLVGTGAKSIAFGSNLAVAGFGVQGAQGGTFRLTVPRLVIAGEETWLLPQELGSSPVSGGTLRLSPQLFSDFGFTNFSLSTDGLPWNSDASGAALRIVGGTSIDLTARTLLLNDGIGQLPGASDLTGLSASSLPLEYRRLPVSLTLQSASAVGNWSQYGSLLVETGASIRGAAGSKFSAASSGDLLFNGDLRIAGGSVALVGLGPSATSSLAYVAHRVEVGDSARIDVSGATRYRPSDAGLRQGTVLAGGSVALTSDLGSIFTRAGSIIDVSGSETLLDLPTDSPEFPFRETPVTSAGGVIAVKAAETVTLSGRLQAGGGGIGDAADAGGTLSVTMTRSVPREAAATYPTGPRTVQLVNDPSASPASGIASIGAELLRAGAFDSLVLAADNEIGIGAGVDYTLARSLTLDSPGISVLGAGLAHVGAAYVAVGPQAFVTTRPGASSGTGQLLLTAGEMDLLESVGLRNINQATFASTGDITLRGYGTFPGALGGKLLAAGNLAFSARRIAPSTRSNFEIATSGDIRFEKSGTSPGTPLSAAGSLSVSGRNITQAGTLIAPFGGITLSASEALRLAPGSMTSVSAGGSLIPYGRVDNGSSWLYGLNPDSPTAVTAIPDRRISLKSPNVDLGAGAVIDVSGGGDLYAFQFTPGTGGSKDVLAGGVLNNTYAIVPSLQGQSVPYDPMLWAQSGLSRGQSVYLAGGSSIAAGTYELLPARYALTPGAYLIRPAASAYQTLSPGESATTVDGASIVAGYRTFADLQYSGPAYTGFEIRPGSYARQLSQYDDWLASKFFARTLGTVDHVPLPADSGTLVVAVEQSLTALSTVRAKAAAGGDNASIEIAAPAIQVTTGGATAAGVVGLSSQLISSWGAGSLLLGGTRTADGAIDVRARTVEVLDNASVTADEVLLTASQSIRVDQGASLASTTARQPSAVPDESRLQSSVDLRFAGANAVNAAVLGVSDLEFQVVKRSAASATAGATVTVAPGASVLTRGALTLDAAGAIDVGSGGISASGASVALGAPHIVFSSQGSVSDGLKVDADLAGVLGAARAISLRSASSIDLAQATTLGTAAKAVGSLDISASEIRNLAPGSASSFQAKRITLSNGSGIIATPSTGTGSLEFDAAEIDLGGGALSLSGIDRAALNASGLVKGTAEGGVVLAGNLDIKASAITADSGVRLTFDAGATGDVSLRASGAAAPSLASLQTGGLLDIRGQDIVADSDLLAPSGVITLGAARDLTLRDSAVIDVSGILPPNAPLGSQGGYVQLHAGRSISGSAGSSLRVSAGPGADAGSIETRSGGVTALAASLSGAASGGGTGGSFGLVAAAIDNLSNLNARLEAAGFKGDRNYEVTNGNLILGATDSINALHIGLAADAGSVTVNGGLVSRSGEQRSSISIAAAGDIDVGAGAVLNASAVDASRYRSGTIELATSGGHIRMASTASVQAAGLGQSGSLTLRAPATATDFNLDSLPADLSRVDSLILQPLKSYTLLGSPDSAALTAIRTNLAGYVAAAKVPTLQRLGLAPTAVQYRPYADLERTGDVRLPGLDLATWRFDAQPATVAVHATGDITVGGTITDGFVGTAETLDLMDTVASGRHSSSISLLAGRDVVLEDGVLLRTGTGDLIVRADRDVVLGLASGIYTGGVKAAGTVTSGDGKTNYPDRGGSLFLSAGRDVLGNAITQSVNDWQLRSPYTTPAGTIGARWGVAFNAFGWNLGALGGGDLQVTAGGNVIDLSAAVADSSASGPGGTRLSTGGGNLLLRTGGDIRSGYFYVARGLGDLRARGSLNTSGTRTFIGNALGTLLISGDASYRIAATGGVQLEGELQAFGLIPTRSIDEFATDPYIFFNRYGPDTQLAIRSAAGDIRLANRPYTFIDDVSASESILAITTQPSLSLSAFGGDVQASAELMSAPRAQLDLYASRDIRGGIFQMSDVNASLHSATDTSNDTNYYADYASAGLNVVHSADPIPVHVTSGRDISGLTVFLPKAVEVRAGRDVLDLAVDAQHAGAAQTSLVSAGRDILNVSDAVRGITRGAITVGGTGRLEVLAGRNIDLEFSRGIATTGNLRNANLPEKTGADIIVMAGLSSRLGLKAAGLQAAGDFIDSVVAPVPAHREALVSYVTSATGLGSSSFDDALSRFRELPLQQQLPFVTGIIFDDLVASGREAGTNPTLGFQRGFAAIEALFPGNKPGEANSTNPFSGDLTLPYSRIYTLSGGSIALLVPGGKIDVGLSTPPSGIARLLSRGPSDLGIVAQGAGSVDIYSDRDVNVNASRIFTLGGGDIAIWSSKGNIDAGKGAKSAISAPPPVLLVDSQGNVSISLSSAVSGSGIRTIITNPQTPAGNVDLIAPAGFVNAGDAGIGSAGNLNIAAQKVVGLDNIQVGGTSSGVPPEAGGLGVSLSGATSSASSASNTASEAANSNQSANQAPSALSQATLSWLEVFVLGLGEENCRQDDLECLKRQKTPEK